MSSLSLLLGISSKVSLFESWVSHLPGLWYILEDPNLLPPKVACFHSFCWPSKSLVIREIQIKITLRFQADITYVSFLCILYNINLCISLSRWVSWMHDEATNDGIMPFISTLYQFLRKTVLSRKDVRNVRSYLNEFQKRTTKKRN